VECRLRNGSLPTVGTHNVEELELDDAHVARIEQLAVLKTCAYQLARGRELFCSAVAPADATVDWVGSYISSEMQHLRFSRRRVSLLTTDASKRHWDQGYDSNRRSPYQRVLWNWLSEY